MYELEETLKDLSNDVKSLYEKTIELNTSRSTGKISSQKHTTMKYAYSCNGVFLLNVIEELQNQGIEVNQQKIESLEYVIEYLSRNLDIKTMNELDEEEMFIIGNLPMKYNHILPIDLTDEKEL